MSSQGHQLFPRSLVIGFLAVIVLPTLLYVSLPHGLTGTDPRIVQPVTTTLTGWRFLMAFPAWFGYWYNENLPFKQPLGRLYYNACRNTDLQPTQNVVAGDDGWYFLKINYSRPGVKDSGRPYDDYMGVNLFTPQELQTAVDNTVRVRDVLAADNIRFAVLICPNKAAVYGDRFLPANLRRLDAAAPTRARQLAAALRQAGVTVVHPEQSLQAQAAASEYPLYYRTDTHWNELGGYLAVRELFQTLDLPTVKTMPLLGEVPVLTASQSLLGDMAKMSCELSKCLEPNYIIDKARVFDQLPQIKDYWFNRAYLCRHLPANPHRPDDSRLFLLADSFSNGILPILACTTSQITVYSRYECNLQAVREAKADIVVLETVERYLDRFLKLRVTSYPVEVPDECTVSPAP